MVMNFQNLTSGQPNVFHSQDTGAGAGSEPESSRFSGAQLAAMRLAQLVSDTPAIKEFLKGLALDEKKFAEILGGGAKAVDQFAEEHKKVFDGAVDAQKKLLDFLSSKNPTEAMKSAFVDVLAKTFTQQQIEMIISLVSNVAGDSRVNEILKKFPDAVGELGKIVTGKATKFFSDLEDVLTSGKKPTAGAAPETTKV
jgi:F0F1-type ATP synthase delta subunit